MMNDNYWMIMIMINDNDINDIIINNDSNDNW